MTASAALVIAACPDAGGTALIPTFDARVPERDAASGSDAGMAPRDASTDAAGPGKDAAVDAGKALGCGEVTSGGRCVSPSLVEICITPTGGSKPPRLSRYECVPGTSCVDNGTIARCALTSDCVSGETSCADATTLRTCSAGKWQNSPCSTRCVATPLGSECAPDVATTTRTFTLELEVRGPNPGRTDWSTPFASKARGLLVISYDGDALLDSAFVSSATADEGKVAIRIAATPSADDTLVIVAAGQDGAGRIAYAVADPGYAASTDVHSTDDAPPSPRLWAWSVETLGVSEAETVTIAAADGAGAGHVFDAARRAYAYAASFYAPKPAPSAVIWIGVGARWDCGACMGASPTSVQGESFEHQIWLDGSDKDQGYWAESVTIHELGHYVMSAYGFPPAEGGPHYLSFPTNPGQAWSEGWATFFSSMLRQSGIYYDKQDGTFFWLDLDARTYSVAQLGWTRAVAAKGLKQLIDENEVAALLRGTRLALGSDAPMLTALAAPRMLTPPFERGYLRREWSDVEHPELFSETSESIPHLADYFDALRCANAISASALDLVTEPATHYPYPSESPLCR